MTSSVPDGPGDLVQAARRYAALSGHFDPRDALRTVTEPESTDAEQLVALASDLAARCDTHAGLTRGTWLMRGSERRWELESLSREGILDAAVDWRRRAGRVVGETQDLLDALIGAEQFDVAAVRRLIADGGPRTLLERTAVALDRAGRAAPAWGLLDLIRAALTRLDNRVRGESLLAGGFVGREPELTAIAGWLRSPAPQAPVSALFVGGLPGIGKSTLLEEAVRRATDHAWITVRLDFDRAGLDVQDWVGLTVEFARQVAAELGDPAHILREARLKATAADAVSSVPSVKGEARERLPGELAQVMASEVRRSGRPLLVLLDTLEVLRGRGETHPERLFAWLDQLVGTGVAPLSVLAAGRGDALDSAQRRVGSRHLLGGLDRASAEAMMARFGVPPASFDAVHDVADGNPLVLRLAATVAEEAGVAPLRRAARRRDLAAAYLYRFLLSRIDEPTLKDLAQPGLVVRRISPEVLGEVLGPQLGHPSIDPAQAVALFEALSQQHWLVQPDPQAPGFVTHRPDLRRVLVRLLYESSPARCARIDRAAAAWFGHRPEPWAQEEAAYHRLQLMRRDPGVPPVDPAVLRRLDEDTISELPTAARDLLRRVRGERSSLARGGADGGDGADGADGAETSLAAATDEFESIVARGDWIEAGHVYDRVFRDAVFDARSRTADAVRAFLWRSGAWGEAKRLLAERDRVRRGDGDVSGLPPPLAAPRLEMRAELAAPQLLRSIARDPAVGELAARSSSHDLRSELSHGALGFVLHRAGARGRPPTSARGHDAVGAAAGLWGPPAAPGEVPASASAFDVAAERLGKRLTAPLERAPRDAAQAARALDPRLLAVLTPYTDVAVTLGRTRPDSGIREHAEAVYRGLVTSGGLPPRGTGPWTLTPAYSEVVDALAALGVLAEWAGAAAFVLRDRDLGLIARSAERWRRTTAGQWSYGRSPATWPDWQRPLDVTTADRVDQLVSAGDPGTASRGQLSTWWGDDAGADAVRALAELRRRVPGALAEARDAAPEGAPAAARALLRHQVPSAFVPPLAVLIARRQY